MVPKANHLTLRARQAMTSFLTLTPNPALDIATSIEHVLPTHKLRCGTVQRYPGGGGINVARVLHRLGAAVEARALVGGPAGAQLEVLLQKEGVPCRMHPISGDTRENMSVLETRTGQEFRFVLPGPTVDPTQSPALQKALLPPSATGESRPRWIIASGSLPPGMQHDFYAQLAHTARQQGSLLALDTSGSALAAALEVGVALVKPSLRELRDLLQRPLNTVQECGDAALALVHQGAAEAVAVSMGEQGAVLAHRDGAWHAPALEIAATTGTTGAGDCFLAALVWALERGDTPPEALRWGVAAGAAALLSPGTALAQAEDIHRLHAQVPMPQVVASTH